MYEKKEHDWILESISNPSFTNTDFKSVGLSTYNVSIGDELMYAQSEIIRTNPAFLTEGKFDNKKFKQYYDLRLLAYNNLAVDTSNQDLASTVSFYKDNVFVPFERVRTGPDTIITLTFNPDRVSIGFDGFNEEGVPKWTPLELAEMYPIFDPETGKFTDYTAEESLFKDFGKTAVMATWDFNADVNGNPTNDPALIYYQKGQYKINPETGTYYYEFTNKPTYDKLVLSKWNILTKEKSKWNLFDFFDSDDKKKSAFGSLMRNAVMLLPLALGSEISALYLGGSLLLGFTNTLATLSKMALGDSSNETLSQIENFIKTTEFTSSEYAMQHTWSAENILNLAGHTFEFLYSMKWMGEQLPKLFGKKAVPITEDEAKAWKIARINELSRDVSEVKKLGETPTLLGRVGESLQANLDESTSLLLGAIPKRVDTELRMLQKNYHEFGEALSKVYMAVSFGTETYGEAKAQGASDAAATALTLGSIAGQYALLKSHIGNWIFPNRLEELRNKKIGELFVEESKRRAAAKVSERTGKAVANLVSENLTNNTAALNLTFFLKWFKKGKDLATTVYTPAETATKASVTGMLAGGIEMTSFEVLRDLTASVYNLANTIMGKDGHMKSFNDGDISGLFDRYASTFFGGALGGLVFGPKRNYKTAKAIHEMTFDQAWQEYVWMMREGKGLEVRNHIKNMKNIAPETLSEAGSELMEDGTVLYKLGSKLDNLNDLWKNRVIEYLEDLEKLAIELNVKVSDNELLNSLAKEYKYINLENTKIASSFLLDFNSTVGDILAYSKAILDFNKTEVKMAEGKTDKLLRDNPEADKLELLTLNSNLKRAKEKFKKFFDGTFGKAYIKAAMWEMSPIISKPYLETINFESFALWSEGVESIKDISQERLKLLKTEYKYLDQSDKILYGHSKFEKVNEYISKLLKSDSQKLSLDLLTTLILLRLKYGNISLKVEDNISGFHSDYLVLVTLLEQYAKTESEDGEVTLFLTSLLQGLQKTEFEEIKTLFSSNYNKIWKVVLENEYLPEIIKVPLLRYASTLNEYIKKPENLYRDNFSEETGEYQEEEIFTKLELNNVKDFLTQIESKPTTAVQDTVFKLADEIFGINSKELFNTAENIINGATSIDELSSNGDFLEQIDKIETAARLYISSLAASVTDDLNINNAISYNKTVNELYNRDLFTTNFILANNLLKEVYTLLNKADLYKAVFEAIENRKLAIHKKVGLEFNISFYKKLNNLVLAIPNGWKKDKLIEALDKADRLKLVLEENITLDEESELKFELEVLDIEEAIFEFFQDNAEVLDDPIKLSEFINSTNFSKDAARSLLSSGGVKNIDDRTFIGLLATFASVSAKSTKFLVKQVLRSLKGTEFGIMPLRTLEISAIMALSYVLNPKVFKNFAKAYNRTLGHSKENTLEEYMFVHPFVLIDAIAGAGKTNAIMPLTVKAALSADESIAKKVYGIHINDNEADNMLKKLGFASGKGMTIEEFMKNNFEDYDIVRNASSGEVKPNEKRYDYDEDDVVRYNLNVKETVDPPTLVIIDEVSRVSNEDFDLLAKLEEKYGTKFILAGDIYLSGVISNKLYPEQLGMNKNNEKSPYMVSSIALNSFFSTMRNAISFRNLNNLKDFNLNILSQYCESFLDSSKIAESNAMNNHVSITLKYHITDDGEIIGDKIGEWEGSDALKLEITQAITYAMAHDLKIGLIYMTEDSPIYKYISEELLEDLRAYIDPYKKKGTSALGGELDYYIIDTTAYSFDNSSEYARLMYTALTRSKQGSLAYIKYDHGTFKRSVDDPNIIQTKGISLNVIDTQIDKYLQLLDKLDTSNVLKMHGAKEKEIKELAPIQELKGDVGKLDDFRNDLNERNASEKIMEPQLLGDKKDENPTKTYEEGDYAHKHSTEKAFLPIYTSMTNGVGGKIVKDVNTGKTIVELNDNVVDSSDPSVKYCDFRRDGANGIRHILKTFGVPDYDNVKYRDVDFVWDLVDKIKNAAELANDKSELLNELKLILQSFLIENGISPGSKLDNLYATFALVSRESVHEDTGKLDTTLSNGKKYLKYLKDKFENIYKLFVPPNLRTRTERHLDLFSDIRLIIGTEESNDLIEVPVLKITNPETYAHTIENLINSGKMSEPTDFRRIVDTIRRIAAERDNGSIDRANDKVYELIFKPYNEGKQVAGELLTYGKLFSIFTIMNNIAIPIFDNDWVPRKSFTFSGPQLALAKAINENEYLWKPYGLEFIPEWVPISEFAKDSRVALSPILVPTSKMILPNGRVLEAGHPVVLVGDSEFKGIDGLGRVDAMLDELFKPLDSNPNRRVTVMEIQKPLATYNDYFDWLESSRDKDVTIKKDKVGNKFTSFRIFLNLYKQIKDRIPTQSAHLDSLYDELVKITEKVKQFEENGLMLEAYNLLLSKSTIEGYTHLSGDSGQPISIWGVFDSFLYDFIVTKRRDIDNRNWVINELLKLGITTTFYETKLLSTEIKSNIRGFAYVNLKPSDKSYQNEGNQYEMILSDNTTVPFYMLGKFDSTTGYGDMTPLLNNILLQIKHPRPGESGSRIWQFRPGVDNFSRKYEANDSKLPKVIPSIKFSNPDLNNTYTSIELLNNDSSIIYFIDPSDSKIKVFGGGTNDIHGKMDIVKETSTHLELRIGGEDYIYVLDSPEGGIDLGGLFLEPLTLYKTKSEMVNVEIMVPVLNDVNFDAEVENSKIKQVLELTGKYQADKQVKLEQEGTTKLSDIFSSPEELLDALDNIEAFADFSDNAEQKRLLVNEIREKIKPSETRETREFQEEYCTFNIINEK